jgi:hypothetical protein
VLSLDWPLWLSLHVIPWLSFQPELLLTFDALEGQVQPFWLDTSDGEKLSCWHVLPLDVYLENESELIQVTSSGEVTEGLEGTVAAKLLKRDPESRVVVNFHGVSFLRLPSLGTLYLSTLSYSIFISASRTASLLFHLVYLLFQLL